MPSQRFPVLAPLSAVLAVALASSSCSEGPTQYDQVYSMTGSVSLAGVRQAGVRIEFTNPSGAGVAFTGPDGSFILSGAPNGEYQVTPVMAGQAFRPASRVATLDNADVPFLHFFMHGSPAHSITGQTSDIAGVRLSLIGDDTAAVLSRAGGLFQIPSLRLGSFTLTPTKTGVTFTPSSVEIDGVIDFTHSATGTVGLVTTASVTYDNGASDASAFFEYPATSAEGIGTIRPRRASELSTGARATYESLFQSAKVVTFAMSSAQGTQTIVLQLLPDHTISSSAANFTLSERLVNATGINFSATIP